MTAEKMKMYKRLTRGRSANLPDRSLPNMADTEKYPSKRAPWETGIPSVIAMRTYNKLTDNTIISINITNVISGDQLGLN